MQLLLRNPYPYFFQNTFAGVDGMVPAVVDDAEVKGEFFAGQAHGVGILYNLGVLVVFDNDFAHSRPLAKVYWKKYG